MASHNRRDPRLPDLIATELMKKGETLQEKIAKARKAQGIKSKWEKYGERAESFAEKAQPGEGE